MRPNSRLAVAFAITVVVIVLCYLGARDELVRPSRATRQAVTNLGGSASQEAYRLCLRYVADGCAP